MENTQYQNQEDQAYQMDEVDESVFVKTSADGTNDSEDGLGKADPGFNYGVPQVLMNLDVFLKNEVARLQALMTDLEAKKQKVEKQVQINKDILERLSLVEKQVQEVVSESARVQKENETIFQQNIKEKGEVGNGEANEPLSLQKIWQ